jgi:hypothetical protein
MVWFNVNNVFWIRRDQIGQLVVEYDGGYDKQAKKEVKQFVVTAATTFGTKIPFPLFADSKQKACEDWIKNFAGAEDAVDVE